LQKWRTFEKRNSFFVKNFINKIVYNKKFLIDCKNPMYFSREFSLEATVLKFQVNWSKFGRVMLQANLKNMFLRKTRI